MQNQPKVVLLGSQGSGKSILVGNITGIYLATATYFPVEWHLSSSPVWSASVSVAYYHSTSDSPPVLCFTLPRQIGEACSSPRNLYTLLKKAELLALHPGADIGHILSLTEETINATLESTSGRSSSGSILYVNMQCPHYTSTDITVVDMPGIDNYLHAREPAPIMYDCIKRLISNYYAQSERNLMAVVIPLSDLAQECPSLSLAQSLDKDMLRTTVIFNHLDKGVPLIPVNPPYKCFYVFPGPFDRVGPFFHLESGVLDLRQQEAAFFTLCEPWSSQLERNNLGIRKLIDSEAWRSLSHGPSPSQISRWTRLCIVLKRIYWPSTFPIRHPKRGLISNVITGTLSLIICVFIMYLVVSLYQEGKVIYIIGLYLLTLLV